MSTNTLLDLIKEFKKFRTWTKRKRELKVLIKTQIKKSDLHTFTASKYVIGLTRFGDTKLIQSNHADIGSTEFPSDKSLEIFCLGLEHCVYYEYAVLKVSNV